MLNITDEYPKINKAMSNNKTELSEMARKIVTFSQIRRCLSKSVAG